MLNTYIKKKFNITSRQGNADQSHNEMSPHTSQSSKDKGRAEFKDEALSVAGNINCWKTMQKSSEFHCFSKYMYLFT